MTDDWLRDALDDAVSDVEPREALDSIRSRTKVTPMSSKRPWIYGVGGAVIATAATITAFALVNSGGTPNAGNQETPVGNGSSATATDSPGTTTPPDTTTETAPVYYLGEVTFHQGEGGDMQTAFRLYREWHEVNVGESADLAKAALQAMFEAPDDADYATLWKGDVLGVTHENGVITVDLSDGVRSMSVGSETAELSVQQLVYTVQGALSMAKEPGASDPVRILVEGQPAGDLWGHVDASKPIARADATGVQAAVWITEPAEGVSVSGPVTVKGVAQVFEANVTWRLLSGGVEVDNGFATASEGAPAFGEYEFELTGLAPGTYVLEVFEASALDGSDTFKDTKTFTVE